MAKRRHDTGIDAARLAALQGAVTPPAAPQQERQAQTAQEAGAETHTPEYTPLEIPQPAPREHMVRVQHYLRPDQIRRLDVLAKRTGQGVTRSDWLRYAVDLLLRQMDA